MMWETIIEISYFLGLMVAVGIVTLVPTYFENNKK